MDLIFLGVSTTENNLSSSLFGTLLGVDVVFRKDGVMMVRNVAQAFQGQLVEDGELDGAIGVLKDIHVDEQTKSADEQSRTYASL
jgi:hypothetical protein